MESCGRRHEGDRANALLAGANYSFSLLTGWLIEVVLPAL